MNDLQEYEKQYRELLRKLSEVEQKDYSTKKELILRLKEVTKPLIKSGKYPGISEKDTAIFLYNEIRNYGISYAQSAFYDLFDETEKRNYFESSPQNKHEHNYVQDPENSRLKTCECGEVLIDNLPYDQRVAIEEPEPKPERPEPELNLTKEEKQGLEYLQRIIVNAKNLAELTNDILDKYKKDKELRSPILKEIGNITPKIEEQKSLESKLLSLVKMSDFRNKVSPFEKIMAKVLIDTTYNIAKVAKLLQISPKHATNNIVKQDHYEKIKWFSSCPKCGEKIADWVNEQILRAEKELPLKSKVPIPT